MNTMKGTITAFLLLYGLAFAAGAVAVDRAKNIIKVTHMSTTEVGIACLNGADPTGVKVGDTVVMSCGR